MKVMVALLLGCIGAWAFSAHAVGPHVAARGYDAQGAYAAASRSNQAPSISPATTKT